MVESGWERTCQPAGGDTQADAHRLQPGQGGQQPVPVLKDPTLQGRWFFTHDFYACLKIVATFFYVQFICTYIFYSYFFYSFYSSSTLKTLLSEI